MLFGKERNNGNFLVEPKYFFPGSPKTHFSKSERKKEWKLQLQSNYMSPNFNASYASHLLHVTRLDYWICVVQFCLVFYSFKNKLKKKRKKKRKKEQHVQTNAKWSLNQILFCCQVFFFPHPAACPDYIYIYIYIRLYYL